MVVSVIGDQPFATPRAAMARPRKLTAKVMTNSTRPVKIRVSILAPEALPKFSAMLAAIVEELARR